MTLNKKLFLTIWLAGLASTLAVLPFAFELQRSALKESPFSMPVLVLLALLESGVLLGVAVFVGLKLALRVGFRLPLLESVFTHNPAGIQWRDFLPLPIGLGIVTGVVIILGDELFRAAGAVIDLGAVASIPLWKRFLGSFYGGIGEEILLRLFLVSLFVWILGKLTRTQAPLSRSGLVWPAIVSAAILFGIGHLPATATVAPLTPLIIARAIALNGIAGLVFGWLYWKRSFEAAAVAHFAVDIVILIVWPLITG